MEAFSKNQKIILNRVRYAFKLFVLADLDGTLVEGGTSATPKLKAKERKILEDLIKSPSTHMGVLSERPVEEVSKAIHVPGVHYSGNLGLEYAVPKGALIELDGAEAVARFNKFTAALKKLAGKANKVTFNNIGLFTCADWSKAAATVRKNFAESARELEAEYESSLRIIHGKQAAEYMPDTGHDKGTAAIAIMRRVGFNLKSDMALYLGDDTTNEDAFAAVADLGIGLRVGRPAPTSNAGYSIKNIDEVWSLLERIIEVRNEKLVEGLAPSARMF